MTAGRRASLGAVIGVWSRFPVLDSQVRDVHGMVVITATLRFGDIGVRSVRGGLGRGSDHRPIIAELVLR